MQVYSLALIVLGASYKMFLFEHIYTDSYSERRSLFGNVGSSRWLASGESAALRFTSEDRQQRIAHLFAGSLTMVFASMDIIALSHRGLKANMNRYEKTQCKARKKMAILHVALRFLLLAFTATVSQYLTEPNILAIVGMFSVLGQLSLDILARSIFDHDPEEVEDALAESVIRYNTARMHQPSDHVESRHGED